MSTLTIHQELTERFSMENVIRATLMEPPAIHHNCHEISRAIAHTMLDAPSEGRVARGYAVGVGGQHSWVMLGDDPYDKAVWIVDASIWSYEDAEPYVAVQQLGWGGYRAHGAGQWHESGRPIRGTGDVLELVEPEGGWSTEAKAFLALLGPLDARGWSMVAHMGMEGWPSGEIIGAMAKTKGLRAFIPIDIRGMLTDENPHHLYW